MSNTTQIKSEKEFKRKSDTTTLYAPMTEKEMLTKLQKSREQTTFRNADAVISDIKSRYGL